MSNEEKRAMPEYADPVESQPVLPQRRKPRKKKNIKMRKRAWCILRRTLLVILTLVVLLVAALAIVLDHVLNGPYPEAQKVLVMSLEEASATKWIAPLFMGQAAVDAIIDPPENNNLAGEQTDTDMIQIDLSGGLSGDSTEWDGHPDGIRIETVGGDTYTGYVMLIRDPSSVYLAVSSTSFSTDKPGKRITQAIEDEGAIAGINAGAFYDNGTTSSVVGSIPQGLTVANGEVVWTSGDTPVGEQTAFVGFTNEHKLIVSQGLTASDVEEMGIRDGCSFGPVLLMNGQINEGAYNGNSGLNPRTAIGQRADGAVIFVCIDGRQASSLGGTYKDLIDIMVEYGAVNACNLDGGSSTVMLYRDPETSEVSMVNSYSLLQEEPRRMPTFFMVRPSED